MFYLTTHSTLYLRLYGVGHMVKIAREETRCRHMGYSFRLAARVLLYAPSHRQGNIYYGLCYTSRGTMVGTRLSRRRHIRDCDQTYCILLLILLSDWKVVVNVLIPGHRQLLWSVEWFLHQRGWSTTNTARRLRAFPPQIYLSHRLESTRRSLCE